MAHVFPRQPKEKILNYNGPYPVHELQAAREVLIKGLQSTNSEILERVKPKIGLHSKYGEPLHPPPLTPQSARNFAESDFEPAEISGLGDRKPKPLFNSSRGPTHTQTPATAGRIQVQQRHDIDTESPSSSSSVIRPRTLIQLNEDTGESPIQHVPDSGSQHGTEERQISVLVSPHKPLDDSDDQHDQSMPAFYSGISTSPTFEDPNGNKRKFTENETQNNYVCNKRLRKEHFANCTFRIHKCDFCEYKSTNGSEVHSHLQDARHFSASTFNACNGAEGIELVSIDKKLTFVNKFGKTQSLCVLCPECHDIFEDIFMCAMHCKYNHGLEGCYSICPVICTETVVVDLNPHCLACGEYFETQRDLHKHWATYPDHSPVTKRPQENTISLFQCPYCNKSFYNDFLLSKLHVLNTHSEQVGNHRSFSAITAKHILKPTKIQTLPPASENAVKDGIQDELRMLKKLRSHWKEMSGHKQKVKQVRRRIQYLNKLVSGDLVHQADPNDSWSY